MPDNQIENLSTRFRKIRAFYGKKQQEFADMAGILQSQVSQVETNEDNITPTIKLALVQNLKVNLHWLETGVGEMFSTNEETNTHKADNASRVSEPKRELTKEEGDPYYENISASAGLGYLMDNGDSRASTFIKVPGVKVDGYINVFGDSMYPKYCAGEVIGVRSIEKELVFFGHAYVLLMSDGEPYIKYIRKGKDENHWSLESENDKYQPKEFHLSKIIKIFKIKAIISRTSL